MVLVDIAFSPDGETVATGSMFGEIVLWDPSNGEERYRLQSGLGSANGIAFSPDGALLVSGHDSGDILMWDLADPSSGPRQLSGHAEPVLALAFSRTGSVLASGGQDQRVSLWDVSGTGPLGTELVGPTGNDSAAIVFSPAGSVLASSTYGDGDVTIWDIAALEPSYELRRDDPRTPTALAFSPNGINLVGGGEGGAVTLWDPHRPIPTRPVARQPWRRRDRCRLQPRRHDGRVNRLGLHDPAVGCRESEAPWRPAHRTRGCLRRRVQPRWVDPRIEQFVGRHTHPLGRGDTRTTSRSARRPHCGRGERGLQSGRVHPCIRGR